MEVLGIPRFWINAGSGADVSTGVDDVRNSGFGTEEEETDDDDSFFDLVIKSPHRIAGKRCDGDMKNDPRLSESPRYGFRTKTEISSSKPLSPVSILRPGPRFKVFMMGFKKSPKASPVNELSRSSKLERSNRFAVKTRPPGTAGAGGPVLARDNSLRTKMLKESCEYGASPDAVVSDEKSVPKYMKLIKPFYLKTSNKARSSDSYTPSSSPVTAPANQSPRRFCEMGRVGSFKIMARSLRKSQSPPSTVDVPAAPPIRRRDDSLLEKHDGIQGAILHCKKSFNNSSLPEISHLSRAASDNSQEKLRRNTFEDQKRCSI